MKYIVTWTNKEGGTAAERREDAKVSLGVFSKWTPSESVTYHQFVQRIDGRGGFAVVESDDPKAVLIDMAKWSPFLEMGLHPVVDILDAMAVFAEATAWLDGAMGT